MEKNDNQLIIESLEIDIRDFENFIENEKFSKKDVLRFLNDIKCKIKDIEF